MASVYLGVGSNIERERYIGVGLDELQSMFGRLELSSVYDGAAVGFAGAPFLNLAVRVDTDLSVGALAAQLRALEHLHGRPPVAIRNSARHLDIDILTYDGLVGVVDDVVLPRDEILTNAFVLCPLAELAPQVRHPVVGESYAALWARYNKASQALQRVAFSWRGRQLPQLAG